MDRLKEKLFAIVVLIALGIIFIPMLLNHKSDLKQKLVLDNLPAEPVVKPEEIGLVKSAAEKPEESKELEEPAESAKPPAMMEPIQAEPPKPFVKETSPIQSPAALPAVVYSPMALFGFSPFAIPNNIFAVKAPLTLFLLDNKTPNLPPPQQKPTIRSALSEEKITEESKIVEEKKTSEKKSEKKEKVKSEERGWSIQLGAFAVKGHAIDLIKKLRKEGYPSYTQQLLSQDVLLTLVFVGPQVSKEEAEKLRKMLEKQFALEAKVVRYVPKNKVIRKNE